MIWAGGEHVFNLNHPYVRNVLDIRGLPGDYGRTPAACFKSFTAGIYSSEDIERVLYLGLVGGGLSIKEAQVLIYRFVRSRPLLETGATAMSVLGTLFAELEPEAA